MVDGFFPAYSPVFDIFPSASLNGLSTGSFYQSTTFDNVTIRAADVRMRMDIRLNGSTVPGGKLDLYLATGHLLGTNTLSDRLTTTTAAGTTVYNIAYSTLIKTLDIPASSNPYVSWEGSLLDLVGSMPPVWCLVLANLSGAPTTASGGNLFTGMFVNYGYA